MLCGATFLVRFVLPAKPAQDTFLAILDSDVLAEEQSAHLRRLQLLCLKNLSTLDEKSGNVAEAMQHCAVALDLDPDDVALAYRMASLALFKAGNVRMARTALERALRSDALFWPALTMLMEMLYAAKDDLGCLDAANRCLIAQPYCERALELRADILFRNGSLSVASCSLMPLGGQGQIVRGVMKIPPREAPPPRKPVAVVTVKVAVLSWTGVVSALSAKLKTCGSLPLQLSWSEARHPAVENAADDENSKSNSQQPSSGSAPSAGATAAPAKQIVLRTDTEQQQQQDLSALLASFLPHIDGPQNVGGAAGPDVLSSGVAASLSDGGTVADDTASVQQWLASPRMGGMWNSVELMDAVCEQVFARVTEPWGPALQRHMNTIGVLVTSLDLPARSYFLGLAELTADMSSAIASSGPGAKRSRKLLERFVFGFSHLLASRTSPAVIRVERLKGLLCKLLGQQALSVHHFEAVKEMLAALGVSQIALAHSRCVINAHMVQKELSALDQAKQGELGSASFKAKDYAAAVEVLAPLLMVPASQVSLDTKQRMRLMEKLYESVRQLCPQEKYVEMFPQVVLAYLQELRHRDGVDAAPSSASVASQIRVILGHVARSDRAWWPPAFQHVMQIHLNGLIVACRGNKTYSGVLCSAWETLFFFIPRPFGQNALSLLVRALASVVEVEAFRLNNGSLLRMVIVEILAGISRFPECDEDVLDQWNWALHQAIQCLYDARVPGFKGHVCKKAGEMTQAVLAEAFGCVGSSLADHDMIFLARKICQKFADLPPVLQERFVALGKLMEDARDEKPALGDGDDEREGDGALPLVLPHPPDLAEVPFAQVYQNIFAYQAVHVIKYCKPVCNTSRTGARSNAVRRWFESKATDESRKLLMMDLAAVPDRFESWYQLGMLSRAMADFKMTFETDYLQDMKQEARGKQAEVRIAAMRCFERSLLCTTDDDMRTRRAQVMSLMALQLLAASRVAANGQEVQELIEAGAVLVQRAKEVDSSAWLPWYVSGMLRRKLRTDPLLYLGDFARAMTVQKFKEKGALFALHKMRLKLALEGECSLDELDSFSYHSQSDKEEDDASRRTAVLQDCLDGLEAAQTDEDKHHVTYLAALCADAMEPDRPFERVDEVMSKMFGTEAAPSTKMATRLAASSATSASNAVAAVHVRELEGYGLPECQVADRVTRKMLRLYVRSLENTRNLLLLASLFQRLMRWASAVIEEGAPGRAFLPELRRCAHALIDVVTINVSVRMEGMDLAADVLNAAYELRTAYNSKHAVVMFQGTWSEAFLVTLNDMFLRSAPCHVQDACESSSPDELLELLLALFEKRTGGSTAALAESPNYSALRKKPRVAIPPTPQIQDLSRVEVIDVDAEYDD